MLVGSAGRDLLRGDVNGDWIADFEITLAGGGQISAADLML